MRRLLAHGLTVASNRDTAQVSQAVSAMVASLKSPDTNSDSREDSAAGLAAIADRIPVESVAETVQAMSAALQREKISPVRAALAGYLSEFAVRLAPAESGRMTEVLSAAMGEEKNADVCCCLADGLGEVARRMTPAEASGVCSRAA